MASGRRSKAERRAAASSSSGVAGGAARGRLWLLLAGAACAVAVAAAAIVLSARGGEETATPTVGGNRLPHAAQVHALFKGVPQRGMMLGSTAAPVTLVEYFDLQCPYCAAFGTDTLPQIVRRYIRPGKVRLEVRPLAFIGPDDSIRGRKALIAASFQNRAFDYAAVLFANQGPENAWLSDEVIGTAARSVHGLDVARLLRERSSATTANVAARFDAQQAADGVPGVPTFFVKKNDEAGSGKRLVNPSAETLESELEAALR